MDNTILDNTLLEYGQKLKDIITSIRNTRIQNKIPNKETIKIVIDTQDELFYHTVHNILLKQVNASEIKIINTKLNRFE